MWCRDGRLLSCDVMCCHVTVGYCHVMSCDGRLLFIYFCLTLRCRVLLLRGVVWMLLRLTANHLMTWGYDCTEYEHPCKSSCDWWHPVSYRQLIVGPSKNACYVCSHCQSQVQAQNSFTQTRFLGSLSTYIVQARKKLFNSVFFKFTTTVCLVLINAQTSTSTDTQPKHIN